MRKKPSYKTFLFKDYYVLGPLSSGVLLIFIGLYFIFIEKNQLGLIGFGSIGVISIILSFVRLFILQKLFKIGVEVKGKVTYISSIRRSYRVTLEYMYEDKPVKTTWVAVKNQIIRDLKNLKEVTILVNPNKIKQAVVLEAFHIN